MYEYSYNNNKHIFSTEEVILNDNEFDTLDIYNSLGDINIEPSNSQDLVVKYEVVLKKTSKDKADKLLNKVKLNKLTVEKTLKFQVDLNEKFKNYEINLHIFVPTSFSNIHCSLSLGDLMLNDLNGKFEISNNMGDIILNNLNGELNMKSSMGDLELKNSSGTFNINSSTGDIYLVDVSGEVQIESSCGDVNLNNVSLRGNNYFDLSCGDITSKIQSTEEAKLIEIKNSMGDIYFVFPKDTTLGNVNKSFMESNANFNLNNILNTQIKFKTTVGSINIK